MLRNNRVSGCGKRTPLRRGALFFFCMRHLIAILICGALLLHAAIDAARPVELDEAGRARAAAYAAYAAGIYLEDRPEAPENTQAAALEKFLQAMAGVDNPLMAFQRAMSLLEDTDGTLDKAAYFRRMRQILEARPETAYQRICLAILALEAGEGDRGVALLSDCLEDPGEHRGLVFTLLGHHYMKTDNLAALRGLLNRLEGEPELAEGHLVRIMRMQAHLRLKEREKAAELAAAIVDDEDTYSRVGILSELFDDLVKLGYVEMTDAFLEQFLLDWGDRLDAAEVERMMGFRLLGAVKDSNPFLFERIIDMALEMEGLSAKFWGKCKGAAFAALEDSGWGNPVGRVYANAIVRLLERERRLRPDKMEQQDGLRWGVYIQAGRIDEAVDGILDIPLISMDTDSLHRMAMLLCQAGRPAEALPFFERVEQAWLSRKPQEVERFFVQFSLAADKAGDMERSLQIMERGLKACPESATLANALGYTLADLNRDLPRAQALVEDALKREPQSSAYLDSLAWAHFRQGRLHEAFDAMQAALAALEEDEWDDPGADELFEHLAQILSAMGHPAAAACWRPQKGVAAQE